MNHQPFCDILDEWAKLKGEKDPAFRETWARIRNLDIMKSCLLDRMFNADEKPSQTPCPVHVGKWSGCHLWGSQLLPDGLYHIVGVGIKNGKRDQQVLEAEGAVLKEWRDAGCRCFQHKCGCTTGWNPDIHCGCLEGATQGEKEL